MSMIFTVKVEYRYGVWLQQPIRDKRTIVQSQNRNPVLMRFFN